MDEQEKNEVQQNQNNNTEKIPSENPSADLDIFKEYISPKTPSIDEEIKNRRKQRRLRYEKEQRKKKIILSFAAVCALIILAAAAWFMFPRTLSSSVYIEDSLNNAFYKNNIYLDGSAVPSLYAPVYSNENVYIPVSFAFSFLGHNILPDYDSFSLSISSESETAVYTPGQDFYYINGEKVESESPLVMLFSYFSGEMYVSGAVLEKFYNVKISFSDENNSLYITQPLSSSAKQYNNALSVKGKPVILFDQITTAAANESSVKNGIPAEADVIVPTWFSFDTTADGKIISLADENYVAFAHSQGVKVWGLLTDNFNSDVCRNAVQSPAVRADVIKQITSFVKQYNLDGINVDFESIPGDSMRKFTQFLRELSVSLNNINAALSIDVYVPRPWSYYYNRNEFGEIADYFIVMGYDEHTEGSEISGSVATKNWSEESISLTKDAGVPAEKLILGIPFYTRIWKETDNLPVETRAYGMEEGKKAMTDKGAVFSWSDSDGQNYAEISYNGSLYKMWLEDAKSVEERLKLVKEYNIAGIAAWRKGLETADVWNVIKKYMKG